MARPKKNVAESIEIDIEKTDIEIGIEKVEETVTENVQPESVETVPEELDEVKPEPVPEKVVTGTLDVLSSICEKYGSDKGITQHGFTPFYDKYLSSIREDVKKVVEVGIDKGKSLKMWKEYFPNATIIGADINIDQNLADERIKLKLVDQGKRLQLMAFKEANDADVIVDDGSHLMSHQQTTLGILFMKLKKGGIYILEDLHTSLIPEYVESFQNELTLDFIVRISEGHFKKSRFMTSEEAKYLKDYVKSVEIFRNGDSITCVITKK